MGTQRTHPVDRDRHTLDPAWWYTPTEGIHQAGHTTEQSITTSGPIQARLRVCRSAGVKNPIGVADTEMTAGYHGPLLDAAELAGAALNGLVAGSSTNTQTLPPAHSCDSRADDRRNS